MFELALRVWTGTEMVYPTKFSVMYDPETRNSSVRIFIKNEKFIVTDYMFITPYKAINGPIFEQDIIVIGDSDDLNIVEFDRELGTFVAKSLETKEFVIMNSEMKFEIIGNVFEDKNILEGEEFIEENENKDISADKDIQENNDTLNEDNDTNKEKQIEEDINPSDIDDKENIKEEDISLEKQDVVEEIDEKPEDLQETIIDEKIEEIIEDVTELEINNDIVEDIDESDYVEIEEENILINKSDKALSVDIHFISDCDDKGNGKYCFTFNIDGKKDTYKGEEEKTNAKRIDLSGIIASLEMLDGNFNVNIYTKSQYVVYPFEKGWIYKWSDSNWYKKENEKIQNYESWEVLLDYVKKYNVKFKIVEKNTDDMEECFNIIKHI